MPSGTTTCPGCGSPQTVKSPDLDAPGNTLAELIEASNQNLVDSGTRAAETAFGVSSNLGFIASGILIIIIFLVFTRIWTVLAVILLILILISILISSLLASHARDTTIRATFERDIKPDIERFIASNNLSHEDAVSKARDLLPEESPLLVYLSNNESD
jgi:hypothetical protein